MFRRTLKPFPASWRRNLHVKVGELDVEFVTRAGKLAMNIGSLDHRCHFPPSWLADQCRCAKCFHAETQQRLREDSVSSSQSGVKSVHQGEPGYLTVEYDNDAHTTVHPISHLYHAGTGASTKHNRFRLDEEMPPIVSDPTQVKLVPVQKVMDSEAGVLDVLNEIDRNGMCFIDGLEVTEEFSKAVLERIAYLRNSIFGDFWSFSVDTGSTQERMEHADTAYTGLAIEPHTDGSYCSDPPGLQAFHVLKFESDMESVQSVLVDGFAVAKAFRDKHPAEFKLLCETDLDWKYYEKGRSHFHARAPIINLDPHNPEKIVQIRWNHYDRSDMRHLLVHEPEKLDPLFDAIFKWRQELLSSPHRLEYCLTPGKMVIFDNWRVLHGRGRFQGQRTLCGSYHDRQAFLSRLSVLRQEDCDMFNS